MENLPVITQEILDKIEYSGKYQDEQYEYRCVLA
jgi:hypothetical protein